MARNFSTFAILATLLVLVTTQVASQDLTIMTQPQSDWHCPIYTGDDITITSNPHSTGSGPALCDTADAITAGNCTGRCCRQTGECSDSSCVNVFDLPNEFNCNGGEHLECLAKITCTSSVGCMGDSTGNNITHCYGTIHCVNGPSDCLGFVEGDLCLYDGNSANFKICTPNGPSSSTGPQSFVVGDPQFVGLRGQSFQIHGVSGEVYNIVSDADLQYNSRFVFLDRGDCPVVNGKKQKGCFAHPGSYLGELGLKTRFGDKIRYASGAATNGFTAVEVNGKQVEIGETILLAGEIGFVSLNSTHLSTIKIGHWQFDFENSDMFINQRVAVNSPSKLRSHGLLGQTWKQVTYPNAIKYIQGEVDDYVIRGRDIFGDEFVFNAFN